jgi:hypothetical protein
VAAAGLAFGRAPSTPTLRGDVVEPVAERPAGPRPHAAIGTGRLTGAPILRSPLVRDPLGGTEAAPEVASALDRLRGRGERLPAELAESLGAAIGADFGAVSIHDDASADRLTRSLQARAFTHGTDIYFRAGNYTPATSAGRHLLSHELVHVAQQQWGSSPGMISDAGPGTVVGRVDDPEEQHAEAVARRISPVALTPSAAAPGTVGADHVRAGGAPVARRTIRRAGDKIAFQAQPGETEEDRQLIVLIKATIDRHQQRKRDAKDTIESEKDRRIEEANRKRLNADDAKKERIQVLKDWHAQYRQGGWHLADLQQEILVATGNAVTIGPSQDDEIRILNSKTRTHLYSILTKNKRFGPGTVTKDQNPVFVKKGTTKEYLQDARGVYISRYVHRGCDLTQMQQLFMKKEMLPRHASDSIGEQIKKFDFGGRTADQKVTEQERDFLQQRDGSGANQRALSTTHAKPTRKIHSNHGELFGSEAILKIDLARVPAKNIFNLHSAETHDTKVALPQRREEPGGTLKTVPAAKEKESYIYSAEKNRETVLLAIPVEAVIEVRLADGKALTLDEARLKYDKWYATEVRLAQEEESRKREEQRRAEEKKAQARQKTAATKASKASAESRRSDILDRVDEMAKKERRLKKWAGSFAERLYGPLQDAKKNWESNIVGSTAPADITVAQALAICELGESLAD